VAFAAAIVLIGKIITEVIINSPKRYYIFALDMDKHRSFVELSTIEKRIAERVLIGVELYFERVGVAPVNIKHLCKAYIEGTITDSDFILLSDCVRESLSKVDKEKLAAVLK
jgi:hypothetical protein